MPALEKDSELLENVLGKLVKNGFEWRGGDTFGQEVVSIYMNEALDEFVMLRYNRPESQPALIHRGAMAELDRPMDDMESLRFVTISEFLGMPKEAAAPAPKEIALPVPAITNRATSAFKPPSA